jgi:hypothetical protein
MNTLANIKTKHLELPTGVTYNANPRSIKKYTARIGYKGTPLFIGNYHTSWEAKAAYEAKANELFNEYRRS